MPIDFSRLMGIVLVTTPCVVVFSVCVGVSGCVCPISSRAWSDGMDYLQFMNISPSSASAYDCMTSLMILAIVNTDAFLVSNSVLLDINKFPLALILGCFSEMCEASLWTARTIPLAWYVIMAYGWVAA